MWDVRCEIRDCRTAYELLTSDLRFLISELMSHVPLTLTYYPFAMRSAIPHSAFRNHSNALEPGSELVGSIVDLKR